MFLKMIFTIKKILSMLITFIIQELLLMGPATKAAISYLGILRQKGHFIVFNFLDIKFCNISN